MSFKNKVVLITGGSSGIGAATAVLLAAEGASVAIVGRNEEKLKNVAEKCKKTGPEPLVIKADVTDDDEARKIIEKTIETFNKLDVLVNNAGMINTGSMLAGNCVESYDEVMKTNVRAPILLTTLAAPHLVKTGGNVVNISSVGALCPPVLPEFLSYSISKAALDHFTRGSAKELGVYGLRVNSINPGPVRTDFMDDGSIAGLDWDKLGAMTLLNKVSEPDDVANVIAFIASEKASGVTGSAFVCDNGFLIK